MQAGQILTITEQQAGVTNAPSLTASKSATGTVQLTATGQTNLRYPFEASSDLARWTKVAVRTHLTGTMEFTPASASALVKFYRVYVPSARCRMPDAGCRSTMRWSVFVSEMGEVRRGVRTAPIQPGSLGTASPALRFMGSLHFQSSGAQGNLEP